MTRRALFVLAVIVCACACLAAALTSRAGARVEVGRAARSAVSSALRARLAHLDADLDLTWYASPRAQWTSELRRAAPALEAFLASARSASPRVRAASVEVGDDPLARTWLANVGVAPDRARRVERDGWSEVELLSTLRIALGARGAALVPIQSLADLDGLSERLIGHLDEIERPSAASFVLSSPPGARKLRTLLGTLGEVADVDFDDDARLPPCDLFVWLEPRRAEPRHLLALRAHLEGGGSALVAGSAWRAVPVDSGAWRVERTDLPADALWPELGLRPSARPVLDARNEALFTVRAPATSQDFRAFRSQPNGTLELALPTTFEPDAERLDELGLSATSLAATSERAFALPDRDGPYDARAFAADESTHFLGRQALLVSLAPRSSRAGWLIAAASSSLFLDGDLAREGLAHEALVRTLAGTLASPERRAVRRAAANTSPLARELSRAERWTARALVVLAIPALLAVFALRSARSFGARSFGAPAWLRSKRALALVGSVTAVCALSALVPVALALDATRERRNTLAPQTVALARRAASAPIEIELVFSPPERLPPELRPSARAARDLVRALAANVDGIAWREIDVETEEAHLAARGIEPVRATSERDEERLVRRVFAHIVLQRGERREVLACADRRAAENLEFRVACALARLDGAPRAHVALHADTPRLTPAEALLAYQKKGLFAPSEGDVYAEARAWLAAHELDISTLDEREPTIDARASVALVLQPRRDAGPLFAELARHLAGGGRAIVCARMFEPRARQRRESGFEPRLWPEPQLPDVDRLWFPRLGISVSNELVFDAAAGSLALEGTREGDDGRDRAVRVTLASPILVRTGSSGVADDPLVRGLGDLTWPAPSAVASDAARLTSLGLRARPLVWTSERAWTFAWSGGDLPAEILRDDTDRPRERRTLAALIEGTFPGPEIDPELPGAPVETRGTGTLVFVGGSTLFQNERLHLAGADHARLLLRLVAGLALEPDLAAILERRASEPAFEPVTGTQRTLLRAFAIGASPLVLLALWFFVRRPRAVVA